jgi:hypothetical protein
MSNVNGRKKANVEIYERASWYVRKPASIGTDNQSSAKGPRDDLGVLKSAV